MFKLPNLLPKKKNEARPEPVDIDTSYVPKRNGGFKLPQRKFTIQQKIKSLFYNDGGSPKRKIASLSIPLAGALFLLVVFGVGIFFIFKTFRNTSVYVNQTTYVNRDDVQEYALSLVREKSFFSIDTDVVGKDIKEKFPVISEVYVNKSVFRGLILDIREYQPIAVLTMKDGRSVLYTNDHKVINGSPLAKQLPSFVYEGKEEYINNIAGDIDRAISLYNKLQDTKIKGIYAFDNFGNLSILTLDGLTTKFDLKEKYHSIDEQVKVLQNALTKDNYKEVDLRFKYLVVKK